MFRDMGYETNPDVELSSREFFERTLTGGRYHGWFIEDAGRIVAGGAVVLTEFQPSPKNPRTLRPYVVNMYTEPADRRKGYAARLMTAIIDWTRQAGYPHLFLHASEAGRPLYRKLGFEDNNEMKLGTS